MSYGVYAVSYVYVYVYIYIYIHYIYIYIYIPIYIYVKLHTHPGPTLRILDTVHPGENVPVLRELYIIYIYNLYI